VVPDPLAALAALEGVPSAVVSSLAAVDAVLRDRGLRVVRAEQSASALLAGARASAELTEEPVRWRPGAVRLSTELVDLSALIRSSPAQAIARAHALAAHGQVPDTRLGRVSGRPEVSVRMAGLSELLSRKTTAPALVLAAVAHAEIASLSPFGSADGLVARAVEHMVLISSGVDPRAVLVPEAGHLALRAEYVDALAGYAVGSVPAVRDWILHCARALAHGAEVSPVARRREESGGAAGG
jgi:hypothetical protein